MRKRLSDPTLFNVEGPLLVIKAWLMSLAAVWVYRRWFERVAAPSPEFEAFCRSGTVLAALACTPGGAGQVRAELVERLSPRLRAAGTLGGWPWPNYALSLQIDVESELVLIRVVGCSLLKTREKPPASLIGVLAELKARSPEIISDAWFHAGLNYGGARHDPKRKGWRFGADQKLESGEALESWLDRRAAQADQQPPSLPQEVGKQTLSGPGPQTPVGPQLTVQLQGCAQIPRSPMPA